MKKRIRYILGWLLVRPRRWLFWQMVANSYLTLIPRKEFYGWNLPNLHWWILYKTVFKFSKWLHYDAWRVFCDWTGGYRRTFPLIARMVKKIGSTTAGFAISGGECFHCASDDGCQVELASDDTGETFILEDQWSVGTQEGTDHRFCGTTICPKCGYRGHYEDGSL